MKIQIPKEYEEHFRDDVVYVTRWKSPSLLLMNEAEHDSFQKILEGSRVDCKDGMLRFIRAGILDLKIEDGAIDIPNGVGSFLQGENRAFHRGKAGIALS